MRRSTSRAPHRTGVTACHRRRSPASSNLAAGRSFAACMHYEAARMTRRLLTKIEQQTKASKGCD
jgi:hypothetical protein